MDRQFTEHSKLHIVPDLGTVNWLSRDALLQTKLLLHSEAPQPGRGPHKPGPVETHAGVRVAWGMLHTGVRVDAGGGKSHTWRWG